MKCVNCEKEFEQKTSGYKRVRLLSEKREEKEVELALDLTTVTPRLYKRDERFLCADCNKLLKSASTGQQARKELFARSAPHSYIQRKRRTGDAEESGPSKRIRVSTPLKKHERRLSTAARYFQSYRYKEGFRHIISKSKSARKALTERVAKVTKKEMKQLLDEKSLSIMSKVSAETFRQVNFSALISSVRRKVPFLYEVLVASISKDRKHKRTNVLEPVLGFILSVIISQMRPRQASLLQKMIAVQMWRCGCKRSLFQVFNRMGICCSNGTMLDTLDKLRESFDHQLSQWKKELQSYVFPGGDDLDRTDHESEVPITPLTSPFPSVSSASSASPSSSLRISSEASEEDDDEWEDLDVIEEGEGTILYGDEDMPYGYTICWDNVGKQLKARRHTRNHGNKYASWALAYVAKNRFNIGVIEENPSTTAGVIKILEDLHRYVPSQDGTVYPIVTWGDGLSCERHVLAQNARANCQNDFTRLKGLEPAAQEFHKRMILLQHVMDTFFSGSSLMEKGTLSHLKNVFNQRSVTKNVAESFNYVADFIKFVTEGYVLLFVMDELNITSIDEVANVDDLETSLNKVADSIIDKLWKEPVIYTPINPESEVYPYCFCKQDLEDEDGLMIECENPECTNGQWFHLECVDLDEDNLPDEWFCSSACRKVEQIISESATADLKLEYCKQLTWYGLSDLVRKDAVRHNDGEQIAIYWKNDLLHFFSRNHPKYTILAHRLIAGINGFLPERLRQDLLFNRTVNMKGGVDKNLEADLVNEFLNREFKESIRQVGSKLTPTTLARHGKLAGGVGKALDVLFGEMTDADIPDVKTGSRKDDRLNDIKYFVELLQPEQLTKPMKERKFKSFQKLNILEKINRDKFMTKMKLLSCKLDRARRVSS